MTNSEIYTIIGISVYLGLVTWVVFFYLTRPYSIHLDIKPQRKARIMRMTLYTMILSFAIYGLLYSFSMPYTGERYYVPDDESEIAQGDYLGH